MAESKQNPGRGVLYTNTFKVKPGHPDLRGELMLLDGTVVKISGWMKETPRGNLVSLAVDTYKGKDEKDYPKDVTPKDDEDLPFN